MFLKSTVLGLCARPLTISFLKNAIIRIAEKKTTLLNLEAIFSKILLK